MYTVRVDFIRSLVFLRYPGWVSCHVIFPHIFTGSHDVLFPVRYQKQDEQDDDGDKGMLLMILILNWRKKERMN